MSTTQEEGIPAVGFLVAAFLDEAAADQALDAMKAAKKQQQFYFEDAAVIRQDAQGKVHYHETGDMGAGKGAGIGALVGGILGILGGPAGMALGAGAGAAVGAAITAGDKGFRNESLNTIGVALRPGSSAIAVITSRDFLKMVQQEVSVVEIRTAVNNLAAELANRLAENKDVAIGVLLTEGGLAVREIAADESSAEVVGAVIASDGAVVGSAVITPEGVAYDVAVVTSAGAVEEAGVVTDEGAVVVDAVALAETDAPTADAAEPASAASAAAEAPGDDADTKPAAPATA